VTNKMPSWKSDSTEEKTKKESYQQNHVTTYR